MLMKPVCLRKKKSLPVRGAWVEIAFRQRQYTLSRSRSPCGERGLKCADCHAVVIGVDGRSPCGERGLKYWKFFCKANNIHVAPRAGSVG